MLQQNNPWGGKRPDLAFINRARSEKFRLERSKNPLKPCRKCGVDKPPTEFGVSKKTYDGRATWCIKCFRLHNMREGIVSWRGKIYDKLGHSCARCGFADKRALQIDHVNGGGSAETKKYHRNLNYYRKIVSDDTGKYQILCANCNWIKRSERGEKMKRIEDPEA